MTASELLKEGIKRYEQRYPERALKLKDQEQSSQEKANANIPSAKINCDASNKPESDASGQS